MTIRICTYTGRLVDLDAPHPEDIDLRDIAHHLALIPRWGGAVRSHYSVAEHSVRVALEVLFQPIRSLGIVRAALLHDAHEAYACDLIDPLREVVGQGYREIEARVGAAIGTRFGLGEQGTVSWALYPSIREADLRLRATEARDLIAWKPPEEWWAALPAPCSSAILPWSSWKAERVFLDFASELGLGREEEP